MLTRGTRDQSSSSVQDQLCRWTNPGESLGLWHSAHESHPLLGRSQGRLGRGRHATPPDLRDG